MAERGESESTASSSPVDCQCAGNFDVRCVCLTNRTTDSPTERRRIVGCPQTPRAMAFLIDNNYEFHVRAQRGDFGFLFEPLPNAEDLNSLFSKELKFQIILKYVSATIDSDGAAHLAKASFQDIVEDLLPEELRMVAEELETDEETVESMPISQLPDCHYKHFRVVEAYFNSV